MFGGGEVLDDGETVDGGELLGHGEVLDGDEVLGRHRSFRMTTRSSGGGGALGRR